MKFCRVCIGTGFAPYVGKGRPASICGECGGSGTEKTGCEDCACLARSRAEAREYVLNALHVLGMYRADIPEHKGLDVSVATAWLKKAVAKLEGKP